MGLASGMVLNSSQLLKDLKEIGDFYEIKQPKVELKS